MVLKHRQNKNQRQRVICFIGSPIQESVQDLVKLAKKLKKNNVAVDIISFGNEQENLEKLEAFINGVNSGDNSHLLSIPPGPQLISDALIGSSIVGEDAGGNFEFGVDPALDPELAMVILLIGIKDVIRGRKSTPRKE